MQGRKVIEAVEAILHQFRSIWLNQDGTAAKKPAWKAHLQLYGALKAIFKMLLFAYLQKYVAVATDRFTV